MFTLTSHLPRQPAKWFAALCMAAGCWLGASGRIRAQEGDVRGVHDPCIAEEKGVYYVFSTGAGVPVRRSSDLVHWQKIGPAFAQNVPAWALEAVPGARGLWAPDISLIDGEYRLYYSVSTFGSWRSCIGMATNRTLDPAAAGYGWVDHGLVLASTPEGTDYNAIDPNIVTDAAGQPWMVFGSFRTGIKIIRLDRRTGKPTPADKPVPVAGRPGTRPQAIEGPFIVRHGGFYYLFVSFDYCCNGAKSDYKVAVGRSRTVTGPYVDATGKLMLEGGGTVILQGDGGRVLAPGHCAVLQRPTGDVLAYHFVDTTDHMAPHLQIRRLLWPEDGFPKVGDLLGSGEAAAPR